jgi:hypothetical protein
MPKDGGVNMLMFHVKHCALRIPTLWRLKREF